MKNPLRVAKRIVCMPTAPACLLALTGILHGAAWAEGGYIGEGAAAHPPLRVHGTKKSDVVFSTRFKREEAPLVAKSFFSNRIEWVYSTDLQFVKALKSVAPWYGGTLNANGPLKDEAGYARDFDGNILVAPWMSGWNGRWVSTAHAETQRVMREQVQNYLDLGVRTLQVDDPMMQVYSAIYQAGDFNTSAVSAFPAWLQKNVSASQIKKAGLLDMGADYREYLKREFKVLDAKDYQRRFRTFPSTELWLSYTRSSVLEYYSRVRALLNTAKGDPVLLSMNLGVLNEPDALNRQFFLADVPDYVVAEVANVDFDAMYAQVATLRALGIELVASIKPSDASTARVAIATLYALGAQAMVPWDVYIGNDSKGQVQRYFGKPDEYGALYKFVRSHPEVLDGLETSAVVGVVVSASKYKSDVTRALVKRLDDRGIPYQFIILGGGSTTPQISVEQLSKLKALILANPRSDFRDEDLAKLAAPRIDLIDAAAAKEDQLAKLQPFFVAPGSESVRVVPRASATNPNKVFLHIIDQTRRDLVNDDACKRRVGIRSEFVGQRKIVSEKWYSASPGSTLSNASSNAGDVFVTINGCSLWGVLEIVFEHK